ncbi:uncharacterized protein LOC122043711 [Zingiber officinale]|uniref:Transmembrane protein n=1 Tax=Zingiber officinale TaxID=94328 RepID=A0A8J5I4V4_ZINOF|nr:uncharacterized protein LOC122043711 [Zingiber officinale]KAG6527950.1 hypothetical protein ZIOFF_010085 [Zingiber officinale]
MERPSSWSDDSWKSTPMNSISFLFLAAAILVLMFLVMAIFERLVKPSRAEPRGEEYRPDSAKKVLNSGNVSSASSGFELLVVMPGRMRPTHLAKPAPPLLPCTREGIHWPPRHHGDHASLLVEQPF